MRFTIRDLLLLTLWAAGLSHHVRLGLPLSILGYCLFWNVLLSYAFFWFPLEKYDRPRRLWVLHFALGLTCCVFLIPELAWWWWGSPQWPDYSNFSAGIF